MERLPPPPDTDDLPDLQETDLRILPAGSRLFRVSFFEGAYPSRWDSFRRFGPVATARFDHHVAPPHDQDRGIMYGAPESAEAIVTCVAEVFQDTRTIDPRRHSPWLASFALTTDLRLLDVTSAWTTRAGGNQAICSGDRERAREWSRSIYARYTNVHGIFYAGSTYGPGRAVVLYERSRSAIPLRPVFNRPLADPGLADSLRRAAHALNYGLL